LELELRMPAWQGPKGPFFLTYSTNIHPGETLAEVEAAISKHTSKLAKTVSPGKPFGLGLRLSRPAVDTLHDDPKAREAFLALLAEKELFPFTLNVFPYGGVGKAAFHAARVKEQVYLPGWDTSERVEYTTRAATVLADLLGPRQHGTMSTIAGVFRGEGVSAATRDTVRKNIVAAAAHLWKLNAERGKLITLCLEPEPFTMIETTDEAIAFFKNELWPKGAAELAALTRLNVAQAEQTLRQVVGVCFDACHLAVMMEDLAGSVVRLDRAGVRVGKVQLSCALELQQPARNLHGAARLFQFAEPRYLHQVVGKQPAGKIMKLLDLTAQFAEQNGEWEKCERWRVHFHVPIFLSAIGPLHTTQEDLALLMDKVVSNGLCPHLEIETYTWDVLPKAARMGGPKDVDECLVREFEWAGRELARLGCTRG